MSRTLSWILIIASIAAILYLVSQTLLPFILAFIFAYLLHPVTDRLAKKAYIGTDKAVYIVYSSFVGVFITVILILIPLIFNQLTLLIEKTPQYKKNFGNIITILSDKINQIDPEIAGKIGDYAHNFIDSALSFFSSFSNHLWQYTVATINFFTIIALLPILLYYFLRDWSKIVNSVESLLPMKKKSKIREIIISINELLSAYIRGQLNICTILACYYILGLNIIGIDLALLFGLISGFAIIIPFIGSILSYIAVSISCYFAFGIGSEFLYTALLFAVGQIMEGYFLTPKIIGGRIGLHPAWIMFAVIAGANLFGLVGILLAVPVAGIIKVCLKHLIEYYKSSNIYKN